MVSEQCSFATSQSLGNCATFAVVQHQATEILIQHVVVVEYAKVLREHVERPSSGAHGAPISRVRVRGAENIRTGSVNFSVDGVGRYTPLLRLPNVVEMKQVLTVV
jgi:hypothetical protein